VHWPIFIIINSRWNGLVWDFVFTGLRPHSNQKPISCSPDIDNSLFLRSFGTSVLPNFHFQVTLIMIMIWQSQSRLFISVSEMFSRSLPSSHITITTTTWFDPVKNINRSLVSGTCQPYHIIPYNISKCESYIGRFIYTWTEPNQTTRAFKIAIIIVKNK